jgi:hypothetical protein
MKDRMQDKRLTIRNSTAEFLVFTSQAGEDGIEVRVEDENVWLTQKLIARLFDVKIPTINEHLKNIFSTNELQENSVIRKFLITADDGKQYHTKHYNLEAIIALGYRISSERATNFRRWATQVLKDSRVPAARQNPVSKSGKKYPVIGCWFLQICIDKTRTPITVHL